MLSQGWWYTGPASPGPASPGPASPGPASPGPASPVRAPGPASGRGSRTGPRCGPFVAGHRRLVLLGGPETTDPPRPDLPGPPRGQGVGRRRRMVRLAAAAAWAPPPGVGRRGARSRVARSRIGPRRQVLHRAAGHRAAVRTIRRRSSTPRPPGRPGDHRSAPPGPSRPATRTGGRTSATNGPPGGRRGLGAAAWAPPRQPGRSGPTGPPPNAGASRPSRPAWRSGRQHDPGTALDRELAHRGMPGRVSSACLTDPGDDPRSAGARATSGLGATRVRGCAPRWAACRRRPLRW